MCEILVGEDYFQFFWRSLTHVGATAVDFGSIWENRVEDTSYLYRTWLGYGIICAC